MFIQAPPAPPRSDERYQELLAQVNDIVFRMTIQGVLTEVSPSVSHILGYTPEEVIGKDITHYISHDSLKKIWGEITYKIVHPAESSLYEIPIQAHDGRMVICEINSRLIRRPGQPPEILGIIRDTTERRRMEDTIRTSEQKFREMYENATEGMYQSTIQGHILSVNNSFARMAGYDTPGELIGRVLDITQLYVHPEDRLRVLQMLDRARMIQNVQVEMNRKNGERRWISLNARMVSHPSGDYIEGSAIDITEEFLLKKILEEKDRVYSLLADNISDVIWTADMDMRVTYMSPSVIRLRGFTPEEASIQQLHEVYTPESLQSLLTSRREGMERLRTDDTQTDLPQYLELAMYHRDGRIIWTETVISLIRGEDRRPIGVVGSIRDISARKAVEQAHREIEERLKEAQQLAQIGNWDLKLQTGVFTCSEEVYRILEVNQGDIPRSFEKFISYIHPDEQEDFRCQYLRTICNADFEESVHRIVLPEGRIKHLHIRGRVICNQEGVADRIIGTIQDITERMTLEDERAKLLRQIQRNIAELTILNDGIRNPLAIIEAVLDLRPDECQDEILKQIARIDAMITQLDKRWAESEKIFSYLQKHYGIT